jgi:hypothetical protein
VIVVPVYRSFLSEDEKISLKQLIHVLGNRNIVIISPDGIDLPIECHNLEIQCFESHYFENIDGYNRLMLSSAFYRRFDRYQYMLIHQLDCLVFRDDLHKWSIKDYSYVAPPWFGKFWHDPELGLWKVGNGGFSLRKISSAIKVLETKVPRGTMKAAIERARNSYIDPLNPSNHYRREINPHTHNDADFVSVEEDIRDYPLNEDLFWSFEASLLDPTFLIPTAQEALPFAFEKCPRWCFEHNSNSLPMGCHAWAKEDREFWLGALSQEDR